MEFIEPTLTLRFQVVGLDLVMRLVVKTGIMKVIGLHLEAPVAMRVRELSGTPLASVTTVLPITVQLDGT